MENDCSFFEADNRPSGVISENILWVNYPEMSESTTWVPSIRIFAEWFYNGSSQLYDPEAYYFKEYIGSEINWSIDEFSICTTQVNSVLPAGCGISRLGNPNITTQVLTTDSDEIVDVGRPLQVEANLPASIRFYPNPASQFLLIESHGLEEATKIELFDLTGRKLLSMELDPSQELFNLDVSSYVNGLYLIKYHLNSIPQVKQINILNH